MMKALFLTGVIPLLAGGSALAHHSHNMYDAEQEIALSGVVSKFAWTNPHAWLHIVVEDDEGREVEWAFETSSPAGLVSRGWRPKDLVPGDEVTVKFHPLRSGDARGELSSVTLADGTTLGH